MIDIHSHILYDVDDGVKDIDESIKILKNMSECGVSDIFLTPHYIEFSKYTSKVASNNRKLTMIKKRIKEEKININVYLGNEIYINENIESLINKKELKGLGKSKYLLIELPLNGEYDGFIDIFLDLIYDGYKVILAHPERYTHYHKNVDELIKIHDRGILFQTNLESILGKYGKASKKTIKKLLKNKCCDFIGSDIHKDKENYKFIDKSLKKYKKYLKDDEFNKITYENAKELIK